MANQRTLTLRRFCRPALAWLLAATCISAPARSQDAAKAPVEYSREQHEELRQKFLSLTKGQKLPVPADESKRGIFIAVEGSHVGQTFYGSIGARSYLIAALRVANLTDAPFTLKTSSIKLRLGEQTLQHQQWPRSWSLRQVVVGDRRLSSIDAVPDSIEFAPGEVKEVVATFLQLPDPEMFSVLRLTVEGTPRPIQFDLMKMAIRRLGLTTERAGPGGCLGVFQIDGAINSVNSRHLISEVNRFVAAGVTRVLIRWHNGADVVNSQVRTWLTSAANNLGKATFSRPAGSFPPIPQGIVEMHLGPVPGTTSSTGYLNGARIHGSNDAAFVAALESAYSRVGVKELLKDATSSNPLVQAAAIQGGVGRLPDSMVPQLLALADGDDKQLRNAAVQALAASSSEQAARKAASLIDFEDVQLASTAIRGLRDSRFPIGQQLLRELLASADTKTRDATANVLIGEVRPEWQDLYYEYAANTDNVSLARRAVKALRRTGHPKIVEMMQQLLESETGSIRREAFQHLASSDDVAAQQIVNEYSLNLLKKGQPDRESLGLIRKLGSREALPLLQKLYPKASSSLQAPMLQTLIDISDETTIPFFQEQYRSATDKDPRRPQILRALHQLRAENVISLARVALKSSNTGMVQQACRILEDDGSPESVHALGKRLVSLSGSKSMDGLASIIIAHLARIGTPWARRYIHYIENGESSTRRRIAKRELLKFLGTSPAYDLYVAAEKAEAQKEIAKSEALYDEAIRMDPNCPSLLIFRGHLKTHSGRRAEGMKDYEKALELDPLEPTATSLRAIGIVVLGDIEGGLREIEDKRDTFKWHGIFNYNAACAYGQAIICTKPTADNLEQVAGWKEKALEYLDHCAENTLFDGMATMDEDTDLVPLYEHEKFKQIHEKVKRKLKIPN